MKRGRTKRTFLLFFGFRVDDIEYPEERERERDIEATYWKTSNGEATSRRKEGKDMIYRRDQGNVSPFLASCRVQPPRCCSCENIYPFLRLAHPSPKTEKLIRRMLMSFPLGSWYRREVRPPLGSKRYSWKDTNHTKAFSNACVLGFRNV